MTRSNKLSNAMLAGVRLGCLLLLFTNFTMAQTILAENFNRPDGTVGNGWSSWWGTIFQHPNISLVNGELRTYGFNGFAGGIFRSVPISFPVAVPKITGTMPAALVQHMMVAQMEQGVALWGNHADGNFRRV